MLKSLWLPAFFCVAACGQAANPVIDNDRVTVWDVTWTKGHANPTLGREHDAVVMWILGGKVRTAAGIIERRSGEAYFSPKSDRREEEGVTEGNAPRSLIVELKDYPVPPIDNKTGYPKAFPRPHAKRLLTNDQAIVWSYQWNPGEPTPVHFHDKDVVVVYLQDTALISTTPDGAKTLNEYKAYDIRFNKRDRTHSELLARGTGSAMMMELK